MVASQLTVSPHVHAFAGIVIATQPALRGLLLLMLLVASDAAGKDRGIGYAHSLKPNKGYGSAASGAALQELRRLGVDSIALTPFGFQRAASDTSIIWIGNGGRRIGETDEAIRAGARQARAAGMRILLKPHIWLRQPEWPGSINHTSAAAWNAWFSSYREFILHYARLAEEIHAETFSIGNEFVNASKHEQAWRDLIAMTRQVYHGRLTYGANMDEIFDVPFWDALDVIGVSAYFPLSDQISPDTATLVSGWRPLVTKLARLSARWKRPILFTEVGYASRDGAAQRPWEEGGGKLNLRLQASAYEAFFRAVWPQPWAAGVYFWKWESFPKHDDGRQIAFTIENKPAAQVMRKYFGASSRTR